LQNTFKAFLVRWSYHRIALVECAAHYSHERTAGRAARKCPQYPACSIKGILLLVTNIADPTVMSHWAAH